MKSVDLCRSQAEGDSLTCRSQAVLPVGVNQSYL